MNGATSRRSTRHLGTLDRRFTRRRMLGVSGSFSPRQSSKQDTRTTGRRDSPADCIPFFSNPEESFSRFDVRASNPENRFGGPRGTANFGAEASRTVDHDDNHDGSSTDRRTNRVCGSSPAPQRLRRRPRGSTRHVSLSWRTRKCDGDDQERVKLGPPRDARKWASERRRPRRVIREPTPKRRQPPAHHRNRNWRPVLQPRVRGSVSLSTTRRTEALRSLFIAVLLMFGIPSALVVLATHRPSGRPPWFTNVEFALLSIAGLAWAVLVVGLITSTWAHLHARGSTDSRVNRLAGQVALAITLLIGLGGAASATPARPSGSEVHSGATQQDQATMRSSKGSAATFYVVQNGDCLWSIAEKLYGDGRRYPLLLEANFRHVFQGGEVFSNPRLIRTGWKLTVPALDPPVPPTRKVPGPVIVAGGNHEEVASSHASTPKTPVALQTNLGAQPSDNDFLPFIGALGLGLLAGAAGSRRKRRQVDDEDEPSMPPVAEAALAFGQEVLQGGLVDAAMTQLAEAAPRGSLPEIADLGRANGQFHASTKTLDHVIAFPLGTNNGQPQIALLPPGSVMSITGPNGPDLLRLGQLLASAWPTQYRATVTSDPNVAADHVALGAEGPLLFIGDPEQLSEMTRSAVVVVTTSSQEPALEVRANEHIEVTSLSGTKTFDRLGVSADLLASLAPDLDEANSAGQGSTAVGTPIVRLLTQVPRIDGLAEALDPRRARRAVEVAAYLALHVAAPLTGEQLRTRVLGSDGTDGAAKSLSNTVSALRRALGVDHEGQQHLPTATRSGSYRLGTHVRCDVTELEGLLTEARHSTDATEVIALVRAACDLIEGPPLEAVVLGYDWFTTEGHASALSVGLTTAVARAAALALDEGFIELGKWMVDRARVLNQYSESLARTAMALAAASGDADLLQREWAQHLQKLDALEPGLAPSAATEDHYWKLQGELSGSS